MSGSSCSTPRRRCSAPPSTDRGPFGSALADLPRGKGKGTVIGDGLAEALDQIEGQWSVDGQTDAAVILLSDGHDTGSSVSPADAAARAAQLGVPVYTVVIGGGGKGGADAALLTQLAATTGGTVATASTAGQLSGVYQKLGTKLSTELKISSSAQFYVLLAVLLAVAAAVFVLVSNRSQQVLGGDVDHVGVQGANEIASMRRGCSRRARRRRSPRARSVRPRRRRSPARRGSRRTA